MSVTPVQLLMIGIGGMAGSWARFRLTTAVHTRMRGAFPWGTLLVNVLGSFLLGLLLPWLVAAPELTAARAFLTVGCIGAFTTFSGFAFESAMLIQVGARRLALLYAAVSVVLGVGSLVAGLLLSRLLAGPLATAMLQ